VGNQTTLHERIAEALGWTVEEAQSFSLQSLRELVRPVSPSLADDLSQRIGSGTLVVRERLPVRRGTSGCLFPRRVYPESM
jgi:hypothetical protein